MILIDEPMPTRCAECFFSTGCNACEGFIDTCTLTGRQFKVKDYGTAYPDPRPDWCPLMEIVHCKECKYGMPCNDGEYYCEKGIGTFDTLVHDPDWFCADGERKEGRRSGNDYYNAEEGR